MSLGFLVKEGQFWFLWRLLKKSDFDERKDPLTPCSSSALDALEEMTHQKKQPFFKSRFISLLLEHLKYISDPAGKDQATIMKYSFAEGWLYLHLLTVNFFAITSEALHFSFWKETELCCQLIRKLLKFPDLKLCTMHLVCSKFKLVSAPKARHKEQHFCYCSKSSSEALSLLCYEPDTCLHVICYLQSNYWLKCNGDLDKKWVSNINDQLCHRSWIFHGICNADWSQPGYRHRTASKGWKKKSATKQSSF